MSVVVMKKIHSVSRAVRKTAPALALAVAAFIGSQEAAYARIESGSITVPFSSDSGLSTPIARTSEAKPVTPPAPAQVETPAPVPMPTIKTMQGLEEPLVPVGPVTDAQENRDLDIALASFRDAPSKAGPNGDYSDFSKPLLAFIALYPHSNWNAALYTDIGLGYYHAGYYSRAFSAFEQAWHLGRDAQDPQAHKLIDRAVAELARMHARLGHATEASAVLADIDNRPVEGPAADILKSVRETLTGIRNNVGKAYLCGPAALKNLLITVGAKPNQIKVVDDAQSGPNGFSLEELAKLAGKSGLRFKLIHRDPGQPIPSPSIVNWSVHHYAAIVGTEDTLYKVVDPTFGNGGQMLLASKAMDAEGSGYFLVPDTVIKANPKAGWRVVSKRSAEARAVYGKGS
jgi:hypothetical protein